MSAAMKNRSGERARMRYAARHDAVTTQRSRIFGPQPPSDFWGAMAQLFRMDPSRDLDPNLDLVASSRSTRRDVVPASR